MRIFLSYLLLLALPFAARAQKLPHVMDWKTDATLNTWLLQKMHAQYAERRTRFEKALRSRKDALAYAADMRRRIRNVVGLFPPPSPLNAVVTGQVQGDAYTIEKIAYESFPHHHVTANLYVPKGKGPFPAALLFCGHEDVSKATESYQKTALLFVRHGFVVFVIDPISQSERYQLIDSSGKALTRGGTTEHTLLNAADNLVATSAPADELWDNVRGLDYLVTRPEVDTARIGCLGNSGGGMQTIYFAGYDPRIKVMAPCSYLATRERTLELSGPADGCAQMPGEGALGLELDDYIMAAAPKPLLVLAGRYDFIDYTGVQIAYDELKRFYTVLGQPSMVDLFTYDDGHGISQPKREEAVRWFRKWLCHDDRPIIEDSPDTHTPAQLQVTTTGQVGTGFPGERSLVQRNLETFDALAGSRQLFLSLRRDTIRAGLRLLLGMNDTSRAAFAETSGPITYNGIKCERTILRREGEPPLPVAIALPHGRPNRLVILLSGDDKFHALDDRPAIDSLVHSGAAVFLADLRGIGETEDRAEFNDPKYYNRDYRNAMLSLHIGRSLMGQRTKDIETILLYTGDRFRGQPVEIRATGAAALPALHAAVLFPAEAKWNIQPPIRSFRELLERPQDKDRYALAVPGAARYYDIPDLFRLLQTQRAKP